MTIEGKIEIQCPRCGKKQETPVWRSLNATDDPEAKQALLEGRVNVFHCPKCALEAPIGIDLLYHDMEREFWVEFYPFEWVDSNDLLEHFTPEGESRTDFGIGPTDIGAESTPYIFRPPHVVFDMNELVRYVQFRDRLYEQSRGKRSESR